MGKIIALSIWITTLVACVVHYAFGGGAATGTFRTTNLIVDEQSNLGDLTHSTNLNGPTRQTVNITDPAYAFGELNLTTVTGIVPAHPLDLFMQVLRSDADADCTTDDQHSGGIAVQVSGSRSAGANTLVNTAIEVTAENAQVNYALRVLKGDFQFDGGGAITQNSGTAFFGGTYLAATGPVIAENNGLYALYISADPGPTSSIYSNAADPSWNAHNVTASVLKLWNDSAPFTLNIAGPVFSVLLKPDGIATLSDGAFGAGSTALTGTITAVGAVSTTITYANPFPVRTRCFAQPLGAVPQFITVSANTNALATFLCFAPTTGAAENCVDFNYWCVGQ